MKQARCVLPTYSADVFGVCSALYEAGGMTVMHDASGCNSTYSTHDEPRWYRSDSLVFISGLTEMDAICGHDEKFINDVTNAANDFKPAFIAIAGTPIPMMTGFDYEAVARKIEKKTGIPCFGFDTNGMNSYLCGASRALSAIAQRMTKNVSVKRKHSVNILGATPLDFSVSGTVPYVRKYLTENGWSVMSSFAMDSTLEEMSQAGEAQVNLVISSVGMKAAQVLKEKFGTPYVVGTPVGKTFSEKILNCLEKTAVDMTDRIAFCDNIPEKGCGVLIIGESIVSRSVAAAFAEKSGQVPRTVYTLEKLPELSGILTANDVIATEEEEIQKICKNASMVIADPLYKAILPSSCEFISLPHEAFSGRMFRKDIPDITKSDFFKEVIL